MPRPEVRLEQWKRFDTQTIEFLAIFIDDKGIASAGWTVADPAAALNYTTVAEFGAEIVLQAESQIRDGTARGKARWEAIIPLLPGALKEIVEAMPRVRRLRVTPS